MKITGRAGSGVLTAAVGLAVFVWAAGAAAQVTVDDFGDTQAVSTGGTASSQVAQTVGTILGGERDMEVSLVSGAGAVAADANTTTASALTFSVPAGAIGRLLVTWDGGDGSDDLDPIGLGGADLTAAGANALNLQGITVTGTVQAVVEVFTDAANVARSARQISAAGDLVLPFGQFQNKLGSPSFANVGAITLELVATGAASLGIADVLTVAPAVQATKVDLVVGGDLDGLGDPGETVRYTIEVSTTGGTAEGVSLEDTVNPSQLTFATGSLQVTPLALDDSFGCLGNVGLDVAAPGLLANDSDPDGSGLAATPISAVNTVSSVGTVVVNTATGAFSYDPPAGFSGVDSFTYTLDDGDGSFDTGTVTIDCSQVLWFIDNSAAGANLGTLTDPFQSLAAFNTANGGGAGKPAAGDCVFIAETGTDYAGGITLLNGQRLVGEGATVGLGTACGVTAPAGSRPLPATGGTRPEILNAGGAGITLAQDNALRGLGIGDTSSAGISGSNFGTLNVREVAIGGGGIALDLDNGTLDATFVSIASTSGTAGIDLDTVGGSLEVTGATTIDGTTGTALKVASAPGGSFDFGDTDLGVTSTVDQGIDLTSNSGATFTFDSLDIDADNGKGLNASSSGTVNIGGTAATIAAINGPALDLESTTLDNGAGGGGWTLARVSSTGSSTVGIDIDSVTGNLTVDDGNAGTADDLRVSGSTGAGIDIATSSGTFTFDSVDLDNTGSHGVLLNGNGTVAINVGTIDGATGDGVNSTNTALTVDLVQFGTISDDGIEVVNSDATGRTVTVQNNNIFTGIGNRGIFINASGAGPLTAVVQANQIASANETILTTDGGTAGSLVLDLQNSTLTRTSAGFTERHVGSGLNSTIVRSWSAPNQVTGTTAAGILFDRVTFDNDGNPGTGIQQVDLTGTLQIGSTGARVAGDGLSFLAPTGDLRIGTLSVANNGGTGLKVDTKTAPGPTTFNLVVAAGTVDTTSGTALDLDPLTGDLTFASVSSTGATNEGILVDGLTGNGPGSPANALTIDDGAAGTGDLTVATPGMEGIEISNSAGGFTFGPDSAVGAGAGGPGVLIDGGTASVTYRGGVTQSAANSLVRVQGGHATGTVTFETGTLSATGGNGLQFDNADGTYNFNGTTTLSGGDAGIDVLNGSSGSFNFGSNASITNPTGVPYNESNSTAAVTYGGTILKNNNANSAVTVSNKSGGTTSFAGQVTAATTTAPGVAIVSSSGAVNFTGGLDVDTTTGNGIDVSGGAVLDVSGMALNTINTTSGKGFEADGGGTLVVTGSARITSGAGIVVDIQNTTIGAGGVTFRSVAKNNATGPGIRLVSTGAGPFTITGDGTTSLGGNGSGGTIENIVGADAVILNTTGGRVRLQNMVIEDISASTDSTAAVGTRTNVDGIHGENVTGGLTLESVTMRRFSDNAVNGSLLSDGISETDFTGLEIYRSVFENSNRYHIGAEELTAGGNKRGDESAEGTVRIIGIDGTVIVTDSTFNRGAQFLDFHTPSSGTLRMRVQNNTFTKTHKEFKCLPADAPAALPVNVGKAGISVLVKGSAAADLIIGDKSSAALGNVFTDNMSASIVILHDSGTSGTIRTEIANNQFVVVDHLTGPGPFPASADECAEGSLQFNHPQGGVHLGPGGGSFEGLVKDNTFNQVMRADGGLGQLTIVMDSGGDSDFVIQGNTFTLPWDAGIEMKADANGSAAILFGGGTAGQPNTYVDGPVAEAGDPNDDVGFSTPSPFNPFLVNVRNNGSLDLKIQSEVLHQHDDVSSGFVHSFDASINASGGTLDLHLDDSRSPDGYNLSRSGGTFNLFAEQNAITCAGSPTAVQILDDNGNTGGSNNDFTDPPVVTASGTITCSTTAPTAPDLTVIPPIP